MMRGVAGREQRTMSYDGREMTPEEIEMGMYGAILSDVRRARINLDHALTTARQRGWTAYAAGLERAVADVAALFDAVAKLPPGGA